MLNRLSLHSAQLSEADSVQSIQRGTNYKIQARKSEGRDRNKNEDKLGTHQARQRSAAALSWLITRWNWPILHTAQRLCFLVLIWRWIHCDRINSNQPKSYPQSSFSPHSLALWAPAAPASATFLAPQLASALQLLLGEKRRQDKYLSTVANPACQETCELPLRLVRFSKDSHC